MLPRTRLFKLVLIGGHLAIVNGIDNDQSVRCRMPIRSSDLAKRDVAVVLPAFIGYLLRDSVGNYRLNMDVATILG
jgi:hypothetical protein